MQMTHKHDVYFSPYSTEAHNLVMQIADYCNKRGIWYKISESTLGIGIEYGGNVAYVIDADRKTEPIQIIIPKNHGRKQAFAMIDEIYAMADRKTEPSLSDKPTSSEKPNNSKEGE
jgi:hypothetical protein